MNIAIILAGGTGNRLGYNIPKQFIEMAGKTVLEHTVDVFEKNSNIDEIAIVIHESYIYEMERMIMNNDWKKVKKILKGGRMRFDSSLSAIHAYQQFPSCNLIFHDAVRPMVSDAILNEVVKALKDYNAVGVSVPVTDTLYQIDDSQCFIKSIPNRSFFHRAQTPQGFKAETIIKAYQRAMKDTEFQLTDDCGVVAKYFPEEKIYLVRGEETNRKITFKEDLIYLQLQK